MFKPFAKEEKEKIDSLRKDGWSIKKIARYFGASDKRVSAYLKGEMDEKPPKPSGKDECLEIYVDKGEFLSVVKGIIKSYEESCYKFVAAFHKVILEEVLDVLTTKNLSKKEVTKRCNDRLGRLLEATREVTYSAGCAAIFTMPPRYKKAWVANILTDSKECLKCNGKKNKNGKK